MGLKRAVGSGSVTTPPTATRGMMGGRTDGWLRCGCGEQSGRRAPATKSCRCRCPLPMPTKKKKDGDGSAAGCALGFYTRLVSSPTIFCPRLASPRFMSRFTIHTSGKVRKGDARLLPNWMKLMVVDLLPEPAGYSRTGERGIFPCSIGWVFFARVDIQGTLHHTLAGKI